MLPDASDFPGGIPALGIFPVIELLGSAKINHECHDVYHIVIVLFKCVEVNSTGD